MTSFIFFLLVLAYALSKYLKHIENKKNDNVLPPPERVTAPRPQPAAPVRAPVAAAPPPAPEQDAYDAPDVVGYSDAQLLSLARGMTWNWGLWARRDLIPPATDERTRLIDEGLYSHGLLTREELAEIHQVGDLWLKYHPNEWAERERLQHVSREAIAARREARKALKEEKRAAARARAEERRKAIQFRRENDIIFLGRGVSAGLNDRRSHNEKLAALSLPLLSTPADVARELGIFIKDLRWLCFHKNVVEKTHYAYTQIPKRSGGTRLISAPKPKLAKAQQWVLDTVLRPLEKHVAPVAHGFVTGRSTVTNAREHLNRAIVVNLDLSNFFPSIRFVRVRGLFKSLGYSPAVATIFALLCTESPRRRVIYDGVSYWAEAAPRGLPQGACTSPLLSNVICRTLDKRLIARSTKLGFHYTRYADDLTFSAADKSANVGLLMASVRHMAEDEGFALNEKKGRVQRRNKRQSVTGVVVNDKLGAPRDEIRVIRAILHKAKTTGLAAQNKDNHPTFEAYLRGKIAYFSMIDAAKAQKLFQALDAVSV